MKTILLTITLAACATTTTVDVEHAKSHDPLTGKPFTLSVTPDNLEKNKLMPIETVFDGFGCTGTNVSPAFSWTPGPVGTKSYAIMVYDPDAPTGVGFHHWWIANLPTTTLRLEKAVGGKDAVLPAGAIQGRNDYGTSFYGGPCPPKGRTHRYQFYVWSLDVASLPVDVNTSPAVARFMINQHALAVGKFERKYER